MKIHQLPQGARFEYEGEVYVKTGPMCGTGPHGQKLIPKYAVLRVSGDATAVAGSAGEALPREAVLLAFERFCTRCAAIVPAERQPELMAARTEFIKSIE